MIEPSAVESLRPDTPLRFTTTVNCTGQMVINNCYVVDDRPLTVEEKQIMRVFNRRRNYQAWLDGSMDCDADDAIAYLEEIS